MKIVRFLATHREGEDSFANHKMTMIVGLDEANRIVPGEWVGYLKLEQEYIPLVLRTEDAVLMGGTTDSQFATTLAKRTIKPGEMFSIGADAMTSEKWEAVFQVKVVHEYN
jgi:hypothetical protein